MSVRVSVYRRLDALETHTHTWSSQEGDSVQRAWIHTPATTAMSMTTITTTTIKPTTSTTSKHYHDNL